MKLKYAFSATITALLAMQAAQAQSSLVSPFGQQKSAAAASLSKAQARSALSATAVSKVDAKELDRILESESTELIVLFNDESPARAAVSQNSSEKLALQKPAFQATRQQVKAAVGADGIEYITEHSALPTALVRVKSRAALVKLLNQPRVKIVAENAKISHTLTESLALINQPLSKTTGRDGAGTTVAVIDEGANYSDAAFGSCTSPGVPANCRISSAISFAGDAYSLIGNSHGSNVAGVIAGTAAGARIAALDVFPNDGRAGTSDMVINALNWVINNQAAQNITSVNLSLEFRALGKSNTTCNGAGLGAVFSDLFTRLRAARVVPVVAAGNSSYSDGIAYPACAAGAVSVGAVYDANIGGRHYPAASCTDYTSAADQITCFSNSGAPLSILAPGAEIVAANVTQSGTSQAAPHVAGAVAVLRGSNAAPNESADQTVNRLLSSGKTIVDGRNGLAKPRLDLLAALDGVLPNAAYRYTTQQVYLAYFGRPADPGGLYAFAEALKNAGAPNEITALNAAYPSNAAVKTLIDSFGNSAESNALYGGDNTAFVTAIYNNLFNRAPDPGGLSFWVGALNNGNLTRGRAALSIMAGGMPNADGVTVNKKATVSTNFTTSLNFANEINAYSNMVAAQKARDMLKQVNAATDPVSFQPTVDNTIARIVSGQ
ncbi:S8 family serine peptidase [Massilia sp. erpn]|uniref:S8 family serine peptidase n=1 Tax=Massilia sp. erpn TaxID=2738142 RepID=UPI0021023A0B|nr:S8 family serine peptidase [Massilia sp. erpn]UTY57384.1 S8 family serine peptidase [Massilia sp. erpn]